MRAVPGSRQFVSFYPGQSDEKGNSVSAIIGAR
jgi:hypothetical protein